MREIRFRAWNKELKRMHKVERIDWHFERGDSLDMVYLIPEDREDDHPELRIHDVELLEYTGLKDVNGTEIYEDDIVEGVGGECAQGIYEFAFSGIVEFKEGTFGINDLLTDTFYPLHDLMDSLNVSVIGNRFENPELLGLLEV